MFMIQIPIDQFILQLFLQYWIYSTIFTTRTKLLFLSFSDKWGHFMNGWSILRFVVEWDMFVFLTRYLSVWCLEKDDSDTIISRLFFSFVLSTYHDVFIYIHHYPLFEICTLAIMSTYMTTAPSHYMTTRQYLETSNTCRLVNTFTSNGFKICVSFSEAFHIHLLETMLGSQICNKKTGPSTNEIQ